MKKLLSILMCLTALTLQAHNLKVCEPYKKDNFGNLHIQHSKSKGEDAKLKACLTVLKGFHVAVYFEHPLPLANIYTKRMQDHKFQIYDVDNDIKTITWLWRNGRKIPDRWTTEIAVRTVVKNKDGKILLTKDKGAAWFLVPGGGVQRGELARDAAVRKLSEEVGITIQPKDLKLVGFLNRTNTYGRKGLNEVVYVFTVEAYTGEPKASSFEVEKLVWATLEEIKQGTVEGIKVHPFAEPLVDQTVESTAKQGYTRMSDSTERKAGAKPMIDVEFIR